MTFDLQTLRRRTVEIDYRFKHRHLPGSLSALPIIAEIYSRTNPVTDVFILSKGHACAAHYAVLEALGYQPRVDLVHPERDPANGVTMTAGSLGHGLPTAVGIAWAKMHKGEPGTVHVLLGDGECQEGTTWEGLHLAARLAVWPRLQVHLDFNGYQGSDGLLIDLRSAMQAIYPVNVYHTRKGEGVKMFEANPLKSTHLVTAEDYTAIMEELK